jgi:hypothetical protein
MGRVGCLVFAAVLLVVGSGCATDVADSAPIFTVQGQGDPIELSAWTFCHKRMCADGHPPDHPPSVGRPPAVAVRFSEPGWTLTAGFSAPNEDCTREFAVPLTRTDNDDWTLQPAGPAGTYDVTLRAAGEPGDAVATFTWTTPVRGTIPAPEAELLTDFLELHVRNLDRTPETGRATITVTAADGTVNTIRPEAEWLEAGTTCSDTGLINFYSGESASRNFGPEPRRYEVRLELDGRRYRAEATTPAEVEERDGHAQVALTFDPPLPAFTG